MSLNCQFQTKARQHSLYFQCEFQRRKAWSQGTLHLSAELRTVMAGVPACTAGGGEVLSLGPAWSELAAFSRLVWGRARGGGHRGSPVEKRLELPAAVAVGKRQLQQSREGWELVASYHWEGEREKNRKVMAYFCYSGRWHKRTTMRR